METISKRRQRRSMLKCSACRARKKKCVPESRDWINGEKCEDCLRRGEQCGPHIRSCKYPSPVSTRASTFNGTVSPERSISTDILATSQPSHPAKLDRNTAISDGDYLSRDNIEGFDYDCEVSTPLQTQGCGNPTRTEISHTASTSLVTTIQERFAQLYTAQDVHRYLLIRRHTSFHLRSISGSTSSKDDVMTWVLTKISRALLWTKKVLTDCSQAILKLLEDVTFDDREVYLLRLHSIIGDIAEHTVTLEVDHIKNARTRENASVSQLSSSVLRHLMSTYEGKKNRLEAHRIRQQLGPSAGGISIGDYRDNIRVEAEGFCSLSAMLTKVIREVDRFSPYIPSFQGPFKVSVSAIQIALMLQRDDTARFLYTNTEDWSEQVDIFGRNILHIAAEVSNMDLLDYLTRQRPEVLKDSMVKRDLWSLTPLFVAAYRGNYDFFKALVEAGANLDVRDGMGRNALYYANATGQAGIVSYILKKGINPDADMILRGTRNESPLHAGIAAGHLNVCDVFTASGAIDSQHHRERMEKNPQRIDEDHEREIVRSDLISVWLNSNPKGLKPDIEHMATPEERIRVCSAQRQLHARMKTWTNDQYGSSYHSPVSVRLDGRFLNRYDSDVIRTAGSVSSTPRLDSLTCRF